LKDAVVRRLEVGYLELQIFSTEAFLSPKAYGKRDLTDESRCCTRDYVVKWSPTGAQC
jgi:hypothetical protein